MLELKALREGAWKLQEYTAFHDKLTFVVSPDLRALLKIAHRTHPTLHAFLIDLQMYRPTWLVATKNMAPKELEFDPEVLGEQFPSH